MLISGFCGHTTKKELLNKYTCHLLIVKTITTQRRRTNVNGLYDHMVFVNLEISLDPASVIS